ncbi:MAG: hypothetical protein ABIY51_15560 [Ferruginibacter sp.]
MKIKKFYDGLRTMEVEALITINKTSSANKYLPAFMDISRCYPY